MIIYQAETTKLSKSVIPTLFGSKYVPEFQSRGNPSNKHKSTRYTVYSFLPHVAFSQLRRVICIFYIVDAVVQMLPFVEKNGSPATSIGFLAVLLLIGCFKEALAERKRRISDK